ncbi:MAG: Smr/MutS family protein [Proteobacteria bacterium]|nr:Smr/MutS family protein [Pseudomonadota bacterium]
MKRPLKPEDRHIWGLVAATVHPLPGKAPPASVEAATRAAAQADVAARIIPPPPAARPPKVRTDLDAIEPNRRHRISKERDPIGARLDLHGYDQDRARAVLERFLVRAWDEGYRAVLVITGKGVQGDGVLKRRAPEWLGAAHLSHMVAGISDAARHHGGEGALYVALKRKPRG